MHRIHVSCAKKMLIEYIENMGGTSNNNVRGLQASYNAVSRVVQVEKRRWGVESITAVTENGDERIRRHKIKAKENNIPNEGRLRAMNGGCGVDHGSIASDDREVHVWVWEKTVEEDGDRWSFDIEEEEQQWRLKKGFNRASGESRANV
ncbi:hypothetical protein QJS10_CPB20g00936 [Acorus calamus]|uniref:Uncharacterized protein n=1 Tax=Acorus calamus TaxID=4465 RepID=A0AAV9CC81_ACOCL|nr:hypothetical protein QJS10_CPB20g00936 [Acorus calamus]